MSSDDALAGGSSSSLRLGFEFKAGTIIGYNYRIIKRLGSGSFGDIYMGETTADGPTKLMVAIKLELTSDKSAQLFNEYKFYRIIAKQTGFPDIYWFSQWEHYNVLVMDLLGKNLDDVFEACGHKFSLKTTILVALQLLDRFEYLHSKKIVYRDVKPENFLLGRPGTASCNTVYIVDFGLSKEYIDPFTGKHIAFREGKSLTGTARYMSINTHLGKEQSRRDDLEALGHLFVYFLRQGKLPWSGLKAPTLKERYRKIGDVKQAMPLEQLCEGHPPEFADYLSYTRKLEFTDEPNYQMLKSGFVDLFKRLNFQEDNQFDWDNKFVE